MIFLAGIRWQRHLKLRNHEDLYVRPLCKNLRPEAPYAPLISPDNPEPMIGPTNYCRDDAGSDEPRAHEVLGLRVQFIVRVRIVSHTRCGLGAWDMGLIDVGVLGLVVLDLGLLDVGSIDVNIFRSGCGRSGFVWCWCIRFGCIRCDRIRCGFHRCEVLGVSIL